MLKRKDIDTVLSSQNRSTRVDDDPAAQSLKLCHGAQALAPSVRERLPRFRLDRYQISPANEQEIDLGFGPARGCPIIHFVTDATIVLICPEQLSHQSLKQNAPFLRSDAAGRALHGPNDARIAPVPFGQFPFSYTEFGFIRRKPEAQECLYQNVQVSCHRRPCHTGFPGDVGHVDSLAVKKGRQRKKTGKSRQVSNKCLCLNLLFKIELCVSQQGCLLWQLSPKR